MRQLGGKGGSKLVAVAGFRCGWTRHEGSDGLRGAVKAGRRERDGGEWDDMSRHIVG